ncbi:nesprin-3 isoform X2 [Cynoglossus semilaevis]|uniref:Spectrin repeat containing, nuclear envelope family member 3 n=1 Tax=Cynoglossus semilaevis TaxID=244447 RepID=A0A3P8WJI3_CYNSE|nr:nesprin-3 isoform X2 [Cynoglossus semilaevis]
MYLCSGKYVQFSKLNFLLHYSAVVGLPLTTMTQQEQQEFTASLDAALSWIASIQERLKANDKTQGTRDALEARLRETEKIHHSQHEGGVKMNMVVVAAEKLLQNKDQEMRNETNNKIKDLKSQWEETCTYIVHCHSRIEWVWLHWSEYLKAYEEFELWLMWRKRHLDAEVELQLGLKEKRWQVDQQRVMVNDVHGQAVLLERLIDEAATLHNRTQDPSLDPEALERLQEAYTDVRDRAEERVLLLQKIAEDHQTYQDCVQRFQLWLLSKTKELTDLMDTENTPEDKLRSLKVLDNSVAAEDKTLQHLEGLAKGVMKNTCPAGAAVVAEEAEELRAGWQRLRQDLLEAEDGLHSSLDSHKQYLDRSLKLEQDIGRLRALLHELDGELDQAHRTEDPTEDKMVGQWRKYKGVKNTLADEEIQVELLKSQLRELFKFSADSRHLSDEVLAVVREHQSVKSRVTRLCSESESGLRNILQDPLLVYTQWSHMVSQVLEASAKDTDYSHITMLLHNIKCLLEKSVQLQMRLSVLHMKGDLMDSVFGPEKVDGLQSELSDAIKNRELLHNQLLQRKNTLQVLISRTKDFGETYKSLCSKLSQLRKRLMDEDGLQPDILAKKSQSGQFRAIQKDLEECEYHITALETLVSSSQSNRTQFEMIHADWKQLCKAVQKKVLESDHTVADHEDFHDNCLNMEKWLKIMKQKLQSFQISPGKWSLEGRQQEVQRVLAEFPEKEIQLQQMEAQSQQVLEKTSEDGQIHIIRDMKRIQESWTDVYNISLSLYKLLDSSVDHTETGWRRTGDISLDNTFLLTVGSGEDECDTWSGSSRLERRRKQDRSVELLRASTSPGNEERVTERGVVTRQSVWEEGQPECFVIDAGNNGASKTFEDNRNVKRDEDSFFWAFDTTDYHNVSKDSKVSHVSGLTSSAVGEDGVEAAKESKDHFKSSRDFEAWLNRENELLSGVLSNKATKVGTNEHKIKVDTLNALRARVPYGQEQFQLLLQASECRGGESGSAVDLGLEDLRYRWMLYKSKLKDAGDIRRRRSGAKRVQVKQEELTSAAKVQKKPGLLQRVCRLALPLWLLLLALLLLLFLLPLMDQSHSCSFSNNFARSFNIMLRYDSPPPT